MLLIFALSGMLVAFATINLYTIITRDYRDLISFDERYIEEKIRFIHQMVDQIK